MGRLFFHSHYVFAHKVPPLLFEKKKKPSDVSHEGSLLAIHLYILKSSSD